MAEHLSPLPAAVLYVVSSLEGGRLRDKSCSRAAQRSRCTDIYSQEKFLTLTQKTQNKCNFVFARADFIVLGEFLHMHDERVSQRTSALPGEESRGGEGRGGRPTEEQLVLQP